MVGTVTTVGNYVTILNHYLIIFTREAALRPYGWAVGHFKMKRDSRETETKGPLSIGLRLKNMKEYTDCFVAFLDILGFKETVNSFQCEEIYDLFDEIRKCTSSSLNYNGIIIEAYRDIKYRILSDSVILFIDSNIADSFPALLDVCTRMQASLISRDKPILIRGCITMGKLYCEDDIIYGEGLTKAYLWEENQAVYPRIIFTGQVLNEGRKNTKYMFPDLYIENSRFVQDEDGLYFADFINYIHLTVDLDKLYDYFTHILSYCKTKFNDEIDQRVRQKYVWLYSFLQKRIKQWPQINDLFNKNSEEKRMKSLEEYNRRMQETFS